MTIRIILTFALGFCALLPRTAYAGVPTTQESKEQKDARMAWWREARFGMFIHWGIYSVPAGQWQGKPVKGIGEWIMKRGNIPVADYAKFAERFNPVKYDADAWVAAAKNAGMKYIIITSKHHDGFAMFHSKASPYNIVDATPFKRDPLKELADACRRHGVKLGFYYSQAQDWHHPGGAGSGWDPAQKGNMDDYIRDVAVPQVKEILSNYGPIAVLWWDTPSSMNESRARALLPALDLRPGIITNNRLGAGFKGDTDTPEQYIPPTGFPGRDFEVCMTMNDTWGFKSDDHNWKPTEKLVRNLCDIASKGGNYLLNVGPTAQGEIPQPSLERLKEIGEWMDRNGRAIYGTTASPFRRYSFEGRATVKGNRLFLHVFEWPAEGIRVVGLKTPVKSAIYVEDGATARFDAGTDDQGVRTLTIKPPASPDPCATVVALELDGPAEADSVAFAVRPKSDGHFELLAGDADIDGKARIEEDFIGHWRDSETTVSWQVNAPAAGEYDLTITYSVDKKSVGATYVVVTAESELAGKVSPTSGTFRAFNTETLGRVKLRAGEQTLTVKPTDKPGESVMNLREIRLTPVK